MEEKISQIQEEYLHKIAQSGSLKELDEAFLALFGKNGVITQIPKSFPNLSKDELKVIAPMFIRVKNELEQAIEKRREEVREDSYKSLVNEKFDLASPDHVWEAGKRKGQLHLITKIEHEIIKLFGKLGFQQFEAPHIDSDEYNFGLLNIPKGHPARDLWDTLYINCHNLKYSQGEMLLRTHTSNAQIRIMKKFKPPVRMVVVDRCFRYENLDPRHEHTFDQFEVVYIDRDLNMAHLQYLSEYFLKAVFGQDIKVRMIPKYFPFVEPGAAVEGQCIFCKGKGCKICGKGWLELAGAGMIHPAVLKNGGINPEIYSGIAWGFGVYRIAMLKYGIPDVRIFNSGVINK